MKGEDIQQEITLAEMMVTDLDKIYKKYAKGALAVYEKRQEKIKESKYLECENIAELHENFGWGFITEEEYNEGVRFFEEMELLKDRKSLIELHRQNIKETRDNWKGTIIHLKKELDILNGVEKVKPLNAFELLEIEMRKERSQEMQLSELTRKAAK